MTLNREKMIDQALNGFFLALNAKDIDRIRQTLRNRQGNIHW